MPTPSRGHGTSRHQVAVVRCAKPPRTLHEQLARHDFFDGTLSPFLRARDRPMATACFGFVTLFFDLRPLFSLPSLYSCIAFSTSLWVFSPYFAIVVPPE